MPPTKRIESTDAPPLVVGLPTVPDGIEAVPGFLRVGDRGFIVHVVKTMQHDDGRDVHVCGSLVVPDPESEGAPAMLAERIAVAQSLRVGALLPFDGADVRCERIEVTTNSRGVVSLCADFADQILSMTRADDRASYREQVRNALRLQPKFERHLDGDE